MIDTLISWIFGFPKTGEEVDLKVPTPTELQQKSGISVNPNFPKGIINSVLVLKPEDLDLSPEGELELADREGLSTKKYLDVVDVQTIGIGETISDIPDLKSWSWDKELTVRQCCDMYKEHLKPYIKAVKEALKVPVTQSQFDALVSITYNIGITGMKKSTFMRRLNNKAPFGSYSKKKGLNGPPDSVGKAIIAWNKPKAVLIRRYKELDLFLNGVYQNIDGKVDYIDPNPKTHKEKIVGRISIKEYLR